MADNPFRGAEGLGSTRACSGPTHAATVAARPHMRTNQNNASWWVIRKITMPGTNGRGPDRVVEEGLAAAPGREERVTPAALEHEAWQRQAEGDKADFHRPGEQRPRR